MAAQQNNKQEKEEDDFGEFQSSSSSAKVQHHTPNSLHQLLGGGIVADVILWRRKEATMSALMGLVSAWFVFQVWGYTLLSFLANTLLLLISILFLWAKAAQLVNRPPPPVPEIQISDEVALYLQSAVNRLLSAFTAISLGKDADLFYTSASVLWLFSVIGSLTTFTTSFYICLIVVLTVPALYEKYEEHIESCISRAYMEVLMYERIYERICYQCYRMLRDSIRDLLQEDS